MNWFGKLKWFFTLIHGQKDEPIQKIGSGNRPKLKREDVVRLIEENGGSEGLDLCGYDLSGANLTRLDLHGVIFGNLDILLFSDSPETFRKSANLEGASLERSNLQRANFGRTNLKRASFYSADLTEATLWAANAEGASFSRANLSRADLFSMVLKDCNLIGANLSGANLHLANLSGAILSAESLGSPRILQESLEDYKEYYTRWYINPMVRKLYMQEHLDLRYKEAMEIYLALKNVFLSAGRYDDASRAYIKERQMEKKTFFPIKAYQYYGYELPKNCSVKSWRWWVFHLKYTIKWTLAWLTELSVGYGEYPLRVVFWAIVVILAFPFLYYLSNGIANPEGYQIRWIDYFHYSLAAFSTIGFPDLIPVNDVVAILSMTAKVRADLPGDRIGINVVGTINGSGANA